MWLHQLVAGRPGIEEESEKLEKKEGPDLEVTLYPHTGSLSQGLHQGGEKSWGQVLGAPSRPSHSHPWHSWGAWGLVFCFSGLGRRSIAFIQGGPT